MLDPADDTGIKGDSTTVRRLPRFIGVATSTTAPRPPT